MSPARPLRDASRRPGSVISIEGVVFQCDADDIVSELLIRPLQHLSQRLRGGGHRRHSPTVPLANHAGIRVRLRRPDGRIRRYVVEQLNGTLLQNVANGLCWTPWRDFRVREGGGWDVTIPARAFRGIDEPEVLAAIRALNEENGQPFYREVCTAFIERIFGGQPLFGQIELVDRLVPGPGPRIPEPAAPLLKPDAHLPRRAKHLLRLDDLEQPRVAVGSVAQEERRLDHPRQGALRLYYWAAAQIDRLWSLRPRPHAA